jgi:hypothetical protein
MRALGRQAAGLPLSHEQQRDDEVEPLQQQTNKQTNKPAPARPIGD